MRPSSLPRQRNCSRNTRRASDVRPQRDAANARDKSGDTEGPAVGVLRLDVLPLSDSGTVSSETMNTESRKQSVLISRSSLRCSRFGIVQSNYSQLPRSGWYAVEEHNRTGGFDKRRTHLKSQSTAQLPCLIPAIHFSLINNHFLQPLFGDLPQQRYFWREQRDPIFL